MSNVTLSKNKISIDEIILGGNSIKGAISSLNDYNAASDGQKLIYAQAVVAAISKVAASDISWGGLTGRPADNASLVTYIDTLVASSVASSATADASITSDKLTSDSVTTDKIVNSSITTAKLSNSSVTENKLASDAVTSSKLADDSILTRHLNDKIILGENIADNTIIDINIKDGSITNSKLEDSVLGKHSIYMPAGAMLPTKTNGASSKTTHLASNIKSISTLDFSGSADKKAQFSIAMPKSWNAGALQFQVYWLCGHSTITNGVVFKMSACSIGNDDSFTAAFGAETSLTDKATSTSNDLIISDVSGDLIVKDAAAGKLAFFQIYRDVSEASDTISVDAKLIGVNITYTTIKATDN